MAKIIVEYDSIRNVHIIQENDDKKIVYKNILKNIENVDKEYEFKKYAIIKPSIIFDNIKEQTDILFECGFNVVFEFLNDRDDFKISYINSEDNQKYVWILPFNKLKRDNKFGAIHDISSSAKSKRSLKRCVNLSKEDLNLSNIIQSTIYFVDFSVSSISTQYKLCSVLLNYLKSPIVSSVRDIKCAFIGDFIFDKENPYENEYISITMKYSYE